MIAKSLMEELIADSPRIARMPRDKRGLPIPYVVLRNDDGVPDFIVNDTQTQLKALSEGRCSVCGETMTDDDVWFVGGQMSGLDPMGCYNDSPVHHECGRFSLQVCPYLALPSHAGMKPVAKQSVLQRLVDEGRATGFIDPTVDKAKPLSYILARARGFVVALTRGDGLGYKLIPSRPFAEIEEWRDGVLLGRAGTTEGLEPFRRRGLDMLRARGETLFTIPEVFQTAWTGGFEGRFPWKN